MMRTKHEKYGELKEKEKGKEKVQHTSYVSQGQQYNQGYYGGESFSQGQQYNPYRGYQNQYSPNQNRMSGGQQQYDVIYVDGNNRSVYDVHVSGGNRNYQPNYGMRY